MGESTERKMTLRFEAEEFEALDNKRHDEKTSFQAVGHGLFLEWLSGSSVPGSRRATRRRTPDVESVPDPAVTPQTDRERELIAAILALLREGDNHPPKRKRPQKGAA